MKLFFTDPVSQESLHSLGTETSTLSPVRESFLDVKLSDRREVESCLSVDLFAQIMCHRALLRPNTNYRVTQNALSEPLGSFEGTF